MPSTRRRLSRASSAIRRGLFALALLDFEHALACATRTKDVKAARIAKGGFERTMGMGGRV